MSGQVKVLWLTKGLGRGGAERLIRLSVPHIDPHRFRVEVAYLLPWKDALVPEIQGQGIAVHCLGQRHSLDPSWVWRLRNLARTRDVDLVHTHSPVPAVAARVALGPRTPILVHTEHNVWDRYRWPTFITNAATYGRNSAALAVSQGVADSVRPPSWMPWVTMPTVEPVHHGIDEQLVCTGAEARAHARALLGIGQDELVVGTVANFTAKKDQPTLLAAVRMLVEDGRRVKLVLIGTGPLERRLRGQAASEPLGDRVLFTGSRDDVQTVLPAFDIFALSSLHEGLPIALLEAMAAGVPCVVTRVGGIPEAVTDGREGLLVPPGDPASLSAALAKLLDNPQLRTDLGGAARARAADFSIIGAVRRMEQVYEQALAKGGRQ